MTDSTIGPCVDFLERIPELATIKINKQLKTAEPKTHRSKPEFNIKQTLTTIQHHIRPEDHTQLEAIQ
jgi:hypothetical protein